MAGLLSVVCLLPLLGRAAEWRLEGQGLSSLPCLQIDYDAPNLLYEGDELEPASEGTATTIKATCCRSYLIVNVPDSHQKMGGAFSKVYNEHDGYPVYQNDDSQYLYYWQHGRRWLVGGDYTSPTPRAFQSSNTEDGCPEAFNYSWEYWDKPQWVTHPVSVVCEASTSKERYPLSSLPQMCGLRAFRDARCSKEVDLIVERLPTKDGISFQSSASEVECLTMKDHQNANVQKDLIKVRKDSESQTYTCRWNPAASEIVIFNGVSICPGCAEQADGTHNMLFSVLLILDFFLALLFFAVYKFWDYGFMVSVLVFYLFLPVITFGPILTIVCYDCGVLTDGNAEETTVQNVPVGGKIGGLSSRINYTHLKQGHCVLYRTSTANSWSKGEVAKVHPHHYYLTDNTKVGRNLALIKLDPEPQECTTLGCKRPAAGNQKGSPCCGSCQRSSDHDVDCDCRYNANRNNVNAAPAAKADNAVINAPIINNKLVSGSCRCSISSCSRRVKDETSCCTECFASDGNSHSIECNKRHMLEENLKTFMDLRTIIPGEAEIWQWNTSQPKCVQFFIYLVLVIIKCVGLLAWFLIAIIVLNVMNLMLVFMYIQVAHAKNDAFAQKANNSVQGHAIMVEPLTKTALKVVCGLFATIPLLTLRAPSLTHMVVLGVANQGIELVIQAALGCYLLAAATCLFLGSLITEGAACFGCNGCNKHQPGAMDREPAGPEA